VGIDIFWWNFPFFIKFLFFLNQKLTSKDEEEMEEKVSEEEKGEAVEEEEKGKEEGEANIEAEEEEEEAMKGHSPRIPKEDQKKQRKLLAMEIKDVEILEGEPALVQAVQERVIFFLFTASNEFFRCLLSFYCFLLTNPTNFFVV